jgi:hypothetical protein
MPKRILRTIRTPYPTDADLRRDYRFPKKDWEFIDKLAAEMLDELQTELQRDRVKQLPNTEPRKKRVKAR